MSIIKQVEGQITLPSKTRPTAFQKHVMNALENEGDTLLVAELIYRNALLSISQDIALTSVASSLSRQLLRMVGKVELDADPKKNAGLLVKMGVSALGALEELDLVGLRLERQADGKTTNFLELKDPMNNPMLDDLKLVSQDANGLIDPTPWTAPFSSDGYSIVKKLKTSRADLYTEDKMPMVYKALNTLAKTEWVVDERVLHVANAIHQDTSHPYHLKMITAEQLHEAMMGLNIGDRKIAFGEQKQIDHLIGRGWSKSFAKKVSKVNARARRKENLAGSLEVLSSHGKRLDASRVLNIANQSVGTPMNFKYNLDSRGRVYAMQLFLTPQGTDLSKSLLNYNNGSEWNSEVAFQLKVHSANCCGEDKGSFEDRAKWVDDNIHNFFDLAEDPLNNVWWTTMKNEDSWQILQCAYALHDFYFNFDTTKCCLPLHRDCSNQGYQILSSLGRDRNIAQEVNVLQHPEKVKGDAYLITAGKLKTLISNSTSDFKEKFEAVETNHFRGVCKRPTMSVAYSAGEDCVIDQVYDDRMTNKKSETLQEMNFKEAHYLGKMTYEAILQTFETPTEVMSEFKKALDGRFTETDSPLVEWTLPSGMTAFQSYSLTTVCKATCKFGRKTTQLNFIYDTGKVKKAKSKLSISANVVHSLDASIMMHLISDMADLGDDNFAPVHDSYAVSPHNTKTMMGLVHNAYKANLGNDRLNKVVDELSLGNYSSADFNYGDFYIENEELGAYLVS